MSFMEDFKERVDARNRVDTMFLWMMVFYIIVLVVFFVVMLLGLQ